MNKSDLRSVLGFWHHQMQFAAKEAILSPATLYNPSYMPWQDANSSESHAYSVFAGQVSAKELWRNMGFSNEKMAVWVDRNLFLYTLNITHTGEYLANSFKIHKHLWAYSKLRANSDTEDILDFHALQDLENQIDEELCAASIRIDRDFLHNLSTSMCSFLLLQESEIWDINYVAIDHIDFAPRTKYLEREKRFLDSFRKIAREIEVNTPVANFIATISNEEKPFGLSGSNSNIWKKNLSPDRFPMVSWPNHKKLNTAEQWIMSDIHNAKEQTTSQSYQAPWGSHRVHILANVIAEFVHKRAHFIANLSKPADGFTMRRFQEAPHDYAKNYYVPLRGLQTSALTISANKQDTLSDMLSALWSRWSTKGNADLDFNLYKDYAIDYLGSVAKSYGDNRAKGLIAIQVDSTDDLLRLVEQLITYLDAEAKKPSAKDTELISFREAKKRFHVVEEKVTRKLRSLDALADDADQLVHFQLERDALYYQKEDQLRAIEEAKLFETDMQDEIKQAESNLKWRIEDKENYKETMHGFWKFVFNLLNMGPYKGQIDKLDEKISAEQKHIASLNESFLAQNKQRLDMQVQFDLLEKQIFLQEDKIKRLELKTQEQRRKLGDSYLDYAFFQNIDSDEKQQIAPWMDDDLACMQIELFYSSLQVLYSFILESTEIRSNLDRLALLLKGKFTREEDREDALPILLSSLRLIVPALHIPNTLLFELEAFTGEAEMGTLLYLDAEKHHAYQMLPLVWKSNRIISLSDHLASRSIHQFIAPIDYYLHENFNIPYAYLDPKLAASDFLLANNDTLLQLGNVQSPFALRYFYEQENPFFDLDNRLLWDNILVGYPLEPASQADDFLEHSDWLDISGRAEMNSIFVPNEAEEFTNLMQAYLAKHGKLPNIAVYMIFPSVYEGFITYAKTHWLETASPFVSRFKPEEIIAWIDAHVFLLADRKKTVADEVVFICGGDTKQSDLVKKILWEDLKTVHTILNVVRRKLLFIGDAELWIESPMMKAIYDVINRSNLIVGSNQKTVYFYPTSETFDPAKKYRSTDVYYAANDDQSIIRFKKMFPEEISPQMTDFFSIAESEESERDESAYDIAPLLDELERLSARTCTVVLSEDWLKQYLAHQSYNHEEDQVVSNRAVQVNLDRVVKVWKIAQVKNVSENEQTEKIELFP